MVIFRNYTKVISQPELNFEYNDRRNRKYPIKKVQTTHPRASCVATAYMSNENA